MYRNMCAGGLELWLRNSMEKHKLQMQTAHDARLLATQARLKGAQARHTRVVLNNLWNLASRHVFHMKSHAWRAWCEHIQNLYTMHDAMERFTAKSKIALKTWKV